MARRSEVLAPLQFLVLVVAGWIQREQAHRLDFLLAEFFTLFAVGWVVAQARVTTGSLWPGIGLHAGWVFGLKYFSALTLGSKALLRGDHLPWIGLNLKMGLVPFGVVLFTGWLASCFWPTPATKPSKS